MNDESTAHLVECTQCGLLPRDLDASDQPEVFVLEHNFGEPYLFGVRCRICGRVATGVGREAAIKAWEDGDHAFNMDEDQT